MKLRKTQSTDLPLQSNIEAIINGQWICLRDIQALENIARQCNVKGDLASDMLAVLQLGNKGWKALTKELEKLNSSTKPSRRNNDLLIVKPFEPRSFREFTLFEKHYSNVTRAHVKRFMPTVFKVTSFYEKLTGKTFPKFKPNKLWYQQPLYYYGSHLNFYSDGDTVDWPSYVKHLDYELELAAIVCKEVQDVSVAEAKEAIGGYVLINDFSSRGFEQKIEMDSGCGPQKSKHFANSISSKVVTADELLEKENKLRGSITINGEKIGECNSNDMHFSFAEIISFLSQGQTLFSGELLASGTLPGGSGMETGRLLQPGDDLVLELEGVGKLANHINAFA